MRLSDLEGQLPSKSRTVGDLARYISTRTDLNPNYTVLLGAGCSVSSGIRSASELIKQWRRELYADLSGDKRKDVSEDVQRELLKKQSWYEQGREYSTLFERRYDLQRQRRMFVEKEVAGKLPSIGYAYLASLIESGYLNTVFTTNFDDLMNEAFYLYSQERPIVCAHDSSINSVTVTSKRPKVIKLHGDYLFDDLKSTTRETENLEHNIRAKLTEFCKDYGLVVIGYSGNDRSIMDALNFLLKDEEYLKSGVYWCLREDTEIPEDLRKLLHRERVYYVRIAGFDELMADLFAALNNGNVVPESALNIGRRPAEIVASLLNSAGGIPTTTDTLRRARERLSRYSTRTAIANSVAGDGDDDRASIGGRSITDDELLKLTEASNLLNSGRHADAVALSHKFLQDDIRIQLKRKLLDIQIAAHLRSGDRTNAIAVADEIIRLSPGRSGGYLTKARLTLDYDLRLAIIEEALRHNPHSVMAHVRLGRAQRARGLEKYGEERTSSLEAARNAFERAVELDPSLRNVAWFDLVELAQVAERDKGKRTRYLEALNGRVQKMGPLSVIALELRRRCARDLPDAEKNKQLEQLRSDIHRADSLHGDEEHAYEKVSIRTITDLRDKVSLVQTVTSLEAKGALVSDPDLAYQAAVGIRSLTGQDDRAVKILREGLRDWDFDVDVFQHLVAALTEIGASDEAEEIWQRYHYRVGHDLSHQTHLLILESRGRYDECLIAVTAYQNQTGRRQTAHQIFYHLCTEDYRTAESLSRAFLEPIRFTPEACEPIVNYELSRVRQGKKVDEKRLRAVLDYSQEPQTAVAVHAVFGHKQDMISALRQALQADLTFRHVFKRWPATKQFASDPEVAKVLEAGPAAIAAA
jgi:tetratricopeptide (TPR) repeat protein